MNLWFVDDSRQRTPSRDRMGPLVSAGGICVQENNVRALELALDELCTRTGFPTGQEFKWSPGRELWMHRSLIDDARRNFFLETVEIARQYNVIGIFACTDGNFEPITGAENHELDVVHLLLERIHHQTPHNEQALVVADRPSGGNARADDSFITSCLDTLRTGTSVITALDRICMVLTCGSHLTRCLQLADMFASSLTAFISGENRWSPPITTAIRSIVRTEMGRIGGCGVKLHPDYLYANLYHWLFADEYLVRGNMGHPLPLQGRPYAATPDIF